MPWYFAGPDAKPVGPLTVQELQDRRASGAISADTYVIEQAGAGAEGMAWRRYKDAFPAIPVTLPPAPATPDLPPAPAAAVHPLFPSAATGGQPVYQPPFITNSWCAWGFALGLVGFFLSFFCVGLLLALPSLLLCIVGLVQVRQKPSQGGQGLAVAGLILSSIAVLISLIIIAALAVPMWKSHELTVTEQTSNDSE